MATGGSVRDFAALIAELAAFREDRLQRQPCDRTLATAAGVSPTTIGDWLRGTRFPQQIDPLLRMVRTVRVHAERAGLSSDPAVASLFNEQRWRDAYETEARRRALEELLGHANSREELVEALRLLHQVHGVPSLRSMVRRAREAGHVTSETSLASLLTAQIFPSNRTMRAFLAALGVADTSPWERAWRRARASETQSVHQVINVAGDAVITSSGDASGAAVGNPPSSVADAAQRPENDLSAQRQAFFFEFLNQALKQAETTFRLSVLFMSGGALILLTGASFL